jgi:hypothetical protein
LSAASESEEWEVADGQEETAKCKVTKSSLSKLRRLVEAEFMQRQQKGVGVPTGGTQNKHGGSGSEDESESGNDDDDRDDRGAGGGGDEGSSREHDRVDADSTSQALDTLSYSRVDISIDEWEAALVNEERNAKRPGVYRWGGLSFMVNMEPTAMLVLECRIAGSVTTSCPSIEDLISFTETADVADGADVTLLIVRSSSSLGITNTLVRLLAIQYCESSQYRRLSYRHRRIDDCMGTRPGHLFTKWNRRRTYSGVDYYCY